MIMIQQAQKARERTMIDNRLIEQKKKIHQNYDILWRKIYMHKTEDSRKNTQKNSRYRGDDYCTTSSAPFK